MQIKFGNSDYFFESQNIFQIKMNNFSDSYVKHSTIHKMQYKDNVGLLIL